MNTSLRSTNRDKMSWHTEALDVVEHAILQIAHMTRMHKNMAASLIHTLPPEIIQDIFYLSLPRFISHTGAWEDENAYSNSDLNHWIHITHVCRYWRSTAINLSQLWSTIAFSGFKSTNSQLLELFLHRSRTLPLKLVILPLKPGEVRTWDWLESACRRVHELHILTFEFPNGLESHIANRALFPSLHTFSAPFLRAPASHGLVYNLVAASTFNVTSLSLPFWPTSSVIIRQTTLQALYISSPNTAGSLRITVSQLLSTLSSCLQLTELGLRGCHIEGAESLLSGSGYQAAMECIGSGKLMKVVFRDCTPITSQTLLSFLGLHSRAEVKIEILKKLGLTWPGGQKDVLSATADDIQGMIPARFLPLVQPTVAPSDSMIRIVSKGVQGQIVLEILIQENFERCC
ncbi:hypothetical protein ABKN59_011280 [Abortiporus biennis]